MPRTAASTGRAARRASRCAFVALAVLALAATPGAQPSSITPVALSADDTAALLARVKRGLIRDRELEAQYTYLEKRRDVKVSKLGRVSLGDVRTFEVYPSVEPGRTYKRLIAVNDVPLPPADLARRDAEHRSRMEAEAARRASESPAQQRARDARIKARMARQRREVDEAFDSFAYLVEGREALDGHARPLLRLKMTPRRDYRPSSENDFVKYARKFAGHAWVDEQDGQVVRIRLTAIEAVTVGLGIVGRVNTGSVATFERRKVNDEVWLPWRARLDVTGRVAIFRKFDFETETTWWDYRKFSVQTAVTDVRER